LLLIRLLLLELVLVPVALPLLPLVLVLVGMRLAGDDSSLLNVCGRSLLLWYDACCTPPSLLKCCYLASLLLRCVTRLHHAPSWLVSLFYTHTAVNCCN
jgi:hypothetical protein